MVLKTQTVLKMLFRSHIQKGYPSKGEIIPVMFKLLQRI